MFAVLICFLAVSNPAFGNRFFEQNKDDCKLLRQPKNGYWSFLNSNLTYDIGQKIPDGEILIVNCEKTFQLRGNKYVTCVKGNWTKPIAKCLKLCPSINSTVSTIVTCTRDDKELANCNNALEGTVAEFRCADYYQNPPLAYRPPLYCTNGHWSDSVPRCEPVCGKVSSSITPRFGSSSATFPWVAAIYKTINSRKTFFCAGSIITQRLILTAAHCVTNENGEANPESLYHVAVGKYFRNIDDERDNDTAQVSNVSNIFIPQQYKGDVQNFLGDFAILVTTKLFTFSEAVQPVCIDWYQRFEVNLNQSINGYITDWGSTTEKINSSPGLKELEVQLVPTDQCFDSIANDLKNFVTHDKLCTNFLDSKISASLGDSGGGLVFMQKDKYYIIGVVSILPRYATAQGGRGGYQYRLYTKVSLYTDFMLQKYAQAQKNNKRQN